MTCPLCGAAINSRNCKVRDSRPVANGIRRRRKCGGCGGSFSTVESVAVLHGGRPLKNSALYADSTSTRLAEIAREAAELVANIEKTITKGAT